MSKEDGLMDGWLGGWTDGQIRQNIVFVQSEVSQKEKHKYSILTHIYGI